MFEVTKSNRGFNGFIHLSTIRQWAYQYVTINNYQYIIKGSGKVKCDEGDIFSKEFGEELASVKAEIDLLKDYKRLLIRLTQKPEWRKEKDVHHMSGGKWEFMTWEEYREYHLERRHGIK